MTIFVPVSARLRICSMAVRSATRSGTAINARPTSISPLNDLGRPHRMRPILPGALPTRLRLQTRLRVRSPGVAQQPLLPGERAAHDGVEIVEPWAPEELGPDAAGARHQRSGIPGSARLLENRQSLSRHPFDALQNLPHAVAVAVADVESGGGAPAAQVAQGIHVSRRQVLDVDVVAHAGAVGGGIVGAEDRDVRSLAESGFAGDLDQQRRVRGGLADAAAGI